VGSAHRLAFIVLLAVVVAVSIKAVGVLLISAFVVIPACAAGRLLSRRFPVYVVSSALLGGGCALVGLLGSGLTNLPSGPCVVMVQFLSFLVALLANEVRSATPPPTG
jgi:zinc/manganese transport system permease protein